MTAFMFMAWVAVVGSLLVVVAIAASRFEAEYRARVGALPAPEEQLRALAERPTAGLRERTRVSWNAYFTQAPDPAVNALREGVLRRLGWALAIALSGLPFVILLARVTEGEDPSLPGSLLTVLLSGIAAIWGYRVSRSARRGDASPRWLIIATLGAVLITAVASFAALRA